MPSANLDLVRSIYANWERGDFRSIEWTDAEFEIVAADGAETGRTGLAGTVQGIREFLSAWENFRITAEEYRELDDGRILVLDRRSGRSKTTGLDLATMRTQGARVFQIREGKVTRLVLYLDRERALADLGLEK
jgi:ketosteroid isomerase-like protein